VKFHEIADLFPLIEGDEFKLLCGDVKKEGLNHPVILLDDKILDGRNRYRACIEVGIEPRYEKFEGEDPLAFVLSENLHRRHLTASQRAALAAEVANMTQSDAGQQYGRGQDSSTNFGQAMSESWDRHWKKQYKKSNAEASDLFQVAKGYVIDAKAIKEKYPDKFRELKAGKKTIQQAKREIIKENVKDQPELPADKYRVVYADPPWNYGNSGLDDYGHAERHYPTMSIEELGKLGVPDIVEENSVLFIWTTSPLLEDCFRVIRMWDFKYKTSFVWNKIKHNFGYYNSVRHELLLVCTKGSCRPDNSKLFNSVQSIERKAHSEKPDEFREIIDTLYTKGKKIELFSRKKVDGWDVWGNQV
jgi:N6-adenosine-specific RNA methylase IME4